LRGCGKVGAETCEASIVPDEEGTWKRVRENDLVNGREIVDPREDVDELVLSWEDEDFK
jgi:hypothetical protein